jgi:hypothetical protein
VADRLLRADEIEDRIDAVRVGGADRFEYGDAVRVLDLLGAEAAGLVGVASDHRDHVRATGVRDLYGVAAYGAGSAHDN